MLKQVPIFSSLNEKEIVKLEAIAHRRKVPKNTIVINEGDDSDCLYILASGRAVALRSDETGRQLIVNRFGPWDCFGEMGFFDGHRRCATVMTREESLLFIIQRRDFISLATQNPAVCWNVISALLDKLRRATQQIEELAFLDVYGRLARFLTENQDRKGEIRERLTHQELADIIGSSRETVSRIMKELISGGYLSRSKDKIVIHKKFPYKY